MNDEKDRVEGEEKAAGAQPFMSDEMSRCMTQFSKSFEASARRWELVVYPSLLAFIILAAYGFYLIYKLTNDVDRITNHFETVAQTMVMVSQEMTEVTGHLRDVNGNMSAITDNMVAMTKVISSQDTSMQSMIASMERMNYNMGNMSMTMHQMRYDTASMGHNLQNTTGPMRFMNSFMPW